MLKLVAVVGSIMFGSSALAQDVVYNVDAANVWGVEYFLGNRTPTGTTALAISAYWTADHQMPEKKVFYFQNAIADNCTKLLHMALAATLSGANGASASLLKNVKLEANGSTVTACKMGSKI
jgi:hypothetical protein